MQAAYARTQNTLTHAAFVEFNSPFVEGNTLILYNFYDLQRLATYICLLHVFIRYKIGPIRKG